ncbi:hypothetical protein CLOP_g21134 [Closterium sp. NIES-67]|nr:hypothetical protein CLOP_g21134 [Closterium sp. NIES-67]
MRDDEKQVALEVEVGQLRIRNMDLKLKLDRLSAALKDSREREAQAVIALEKGGKEKEEVAREVEAGQWRIKQMDLQVTIKKLREELKTRTESMRQRLLS